MRALCSCALCLESPFVENLVDGAICFQLGERGVDLRKQLRIPLADPDRDGADNIAARSGKFYL